MDSPGKFLEIQWLYYVTFYAFSVSLHAFFLFLDEVIITTGMLVTHSIPGFLCF